MSEFARIHLCRNAMKTVTAALFGVMSFGFYASAASAQSSSVSASPPMSEGAVPGAASGLYIAEIAEITDPETFREYAAAVPETVRLYKGVYLTRGHPVEGLEGEPPRGVVIIQFPSVEDARRWYNSPDYGAIRGIRQRSAKARNFFVRAN